MENKQKKLIAKLNSSDSKTILEALVTVRNDGNFTLFPYIMDIYKKNADSEIQNEIYKMLCDLNDNENARFLVQYIEKESFADIKSKLLNVCWNCRLDFSPHLSFFVDLFINEEFENAFDAFTVIENIDASFEQSTIFAETNKLKNNLRTISPDKKELLVQLVKVLEAKHI